MTFCCPFLEGWGWEMGGRQWTGDQCSQTVTVCGWSAVFTQRNKQEEVENKTSCTPWCPSLQREDWFVITLLGMRRVSPGVSRWTRKQLRESAQPSVHQCFIISCGAISVAGKRTRTIDPEKNKLVKNKKSETVRSRPVDWKWNAHDWWGFVRREFQWLADFHSS